MPLNVRNNISGSELLFLPKPEDIKILVIDDEKELLDSVNLIFELLDYKIDTASSGEEGIEKLKKNNYDIVITDISMPGISGFEVVEYVTKNHPYTVPIVMTAFIDADTAIQSFKSGAYDFVKKPFNKEMLLLALDRALAKRAVILAEEHYKKILEEEVEKRTETIRKLNENILSLYQLSQLTKESIELDKILQNFREFSVKLFDCESFAIILYSTASRFLVVHGSYFSKTNSKPNRHVFPENFFSDIEQKQIRNKIILFDDDKHSILVKLIRNNVFLGFLYLGFNNKEKIDKVSPQLIELFVSELESTLFHNRLLEQHSEKMKEMVMKAVKTHAYSIEAKDPYTKGHCDRVEIFSTIIAKRLISDKEELFNFRIACILHDIGKIGVSDAIIKKPGKLTKDEYEEMKKHPVIGANIAAPLYGEKIAKIIKYHHEWFNGNGYPDGLKGEEIPLESRIIMIGDTYDAMTSTRPYRKAKTPEEAYAEILKFSGKQFDPELVKIFMEVFDEFKNVKIDQSEFEIKF